MYKVTDNMSGHYGIRGHFLKLFFLVKSASCQQKLIYGEITRARWGNEAGV